MKPLWEQKTLGDISTIERGGSPRPIKDYITTSADGINWIKIGDGQVGSKYITCTEEKIKPAGVRRSRMVYEGDFILSNSMSFGRPYIMKTQGCIHDGWVVLRKPSIDPDFLYYILSSGPVAQQFERSAAGTTVRNLNIDRIRGVRIPIPPPDEQRRIVAILDEAFEGIAAATACAASNLRKASDLFEAERSRAFSQRKSDWVTMALSQLCRLINGRAYKKPELLSSGKYRVLRVGNFFTNTHWYYSDLELDPDKYCEPGDLLYAWSASFGPRIWEGEKAIFHYHIWRVIPDEKLIRKEFLHHLLAWDVDNIKSAHGTGTTMIHVSKGSMEAREVPVPSLEEQERLVRLLDDLAGESQRLAGLFSSKLAALELLKASLLHQAFTGQL